MSPALILTLDWNNNFLHVTLQIQGRKVKPCHTAQGKQWKRNPQGSKANYRGSTCGLHPRDGARAHWAAEPSCPVSKPGSCIHLSHWSR